MMHGRTIGLQDEGTTSRSHLRQVLALLVMLLAVVPHLTMAASPLPGIAPLRIAHAAAASEAAAGKMPCHEQRSDPAHPAAMPACCVIGCGLLAEAPTVALPFRTLAWSRLQSLAALLHAGISREPAKPPPRPEPVLL